MDLISGKVTKRKREKCERLRKKGKVKGKKELCIQGENMFNLLNLSTVRGIAISKYVQYINSPRDCQIKICSVYKQSAGLSDKNMFSI